MIENGVNMFKKSPCSKIYHFSFDSSEQLISIFSLSGSSNNNYCSINVTRKMKWTEINTRKKNSTFRLRTVPFDPAQRRFLKSHFKARIRVGRQKIIIYGISTKRAQLSLLCPDDK